MLTADQEEREFDTRMAQMQADIDLRRDQQRNVQQDRRLDPTRVINSAAPAVAAITGAAGTVLGYVIGRSGH